MLSRQLLNELSRTVAPTLSVSARARPAWRRAASSSSRPAPQTPEEIERDVERRLSAIKQQREAEEAERREQAERLEREARKELAVRDARKALEVEKEKEALRKASEAKASLRPIKTETSELTASSSALPSSSSASSTTASTITSTATSSATTTQSATATSSSPAAAASSCPSQTIPGEAGKPSQTISALQTQATVQAQELAQKLQRQITELRGALAVQRRLLGTRAKTEFAQLGGRINHITGYDEVEKLKDEVGRRESEIGQLRTAAKAAKLAYEQAVQARSTSQRDVTSLLERKHTWTDADVVKFTALVRSDHTSNNLVHTTSAELEAAEQAVDAAFSELMRSILTRYHEEQVWSDKIRNLSTYAGLLAVAANLIVFLTAIVLVEPWKRRRLVQGLEERVEGMMSRMESVIGEEIERVEVKIGAINETLQASAAASRHQPQAPTVLPSAEHTGTLVDSPALNSASTFLGKTRDWIAPAFQEGGFAYLGSGSKLNTALSVLTLTTIFGMIFRPSS